jgi:hypothetical protein
MKSTTVETLDAGASAAACMGSHPGQLMTYILAKTVHKETASLTACREPTDPTASRCMAGAAGDTIVNDINAADCCITYLSEDVFDVLQRPPHGAGQLAHQPTRRAEQVIAPHSSAGVLNIYGSELHGAGNL